MYIVLSENKDLDNQEQMPSISCFLKTPLSWMSILGLVLASFLFGYGISSIILTSILTLSTLFFNFSKRKSRLQVDKSAKDELIFAADHQESKGCIKDIAAKPVVMGEDEHIKQKIEGDRAEEEDETDEYLIRSSPAILSESECLGRSSTSEDSEVECWAYQDNMFRSPDCSDGSISDEDSLIEIALPSGHYIGDYKEEDPKFNLHKSFLKQHSTLVELLAEINDMNEEDNLIEIDISMGSIKCPRFEIQA